jgi:hypothetical protein
MPGEDCIYTYNLMPVERGLQLRQGYREWATGAGTGDVRTIISYESPSQSAANDRLWAVTKEGIYNVTSFSETTPTKDVTFGTTTDPAGFGVYCEFTNDASDHFLFFADALNGIHQYKEGTGWSVPAGWTYADGGGAFPVADVVFVMVHKLRIWVILEDSDDAYYLPVSSISGTLTKFTFGSKMDHGGDLMGLWSWTVDGGAGVDDMLVGVSRGGDVMVYQGQDPSLDDFWMIGNWFIGRTPNSRRLVASYGSEIYVLSTFGVTALKDLLSGVSADTLRNSPSYKINRALRLAILQDSSSQEWALNIHPADGFMQVVAPYASNAEPIMYNQNLTTQAWGYWEGVPILCGASWKGEYYMGSASGVTQQYFGVLDGTTLAGAAGEPVEYRTLTSFQPLTNHASFKRAGFIRTLAISSDIESFNTRAVWDYEENSAIPQSTAPLGTYGAIWDTDTWDNAIWDATTEGRSYPKGALGLGRTFAIAMRGQANVRIEVIGWDVMFTEGGLL